MRRLSFSIAASVTAAAVLLAAGPVAAHHSFAMFNRDRIVPVSGTVKAFQWANPHIWVQLLVPGKNGGPPVEWSIEGGSVNALGRGGGWKRSSLKVGDKVVVYIHPLKDGQTGGELVNASVNGKLIGPEEVN